LLLKKSGYEVVSVENGKDCLQALEQSSFDVVLMDILMPVMDGETALSEIRMNEAGTTRHQPVIALTANAIYGDKEMLLKKGFDGYVSKPFQIDKLVAEINIVTGQIVS